MYLSLGVIQVRKNLSSKYDKYKDMADLIPRALVIKYPPGMILCSTVFQHRL